MGKKETKSDAEEWTRIAELFPPTTKTEPSTLAELAESINHCSAFAYFAVTGDAYQPIANADFGHFYQLYVDLGGEDFDLAQNWLLNLKKLEVKCREANPESQNHENHGVES